MKVCIFHSRKVKDPTWIPHLLMHISWETSFNRMYKIKSDYKYNKETFPMLLVKNGSTNNTCALQSSHRGECIPTPWTSLQEQCVEEANDVAKQRNGSIRTRKHREVGHGLAQYDHSGCGHWGGWVESLLSIFFSNLITISNIGHSVEAVKKRIAYQKSQKHLPIHRLNGSKDPCLACSEGHLPPRHS